MDRIVQFGPRGQLVGLLSGDTLPHGAPILVLPSAGLLPRCGPFRLHVELAQRLAPCGIRTFRFEVPGVGETPRLAGWGPREATAAALDHLAAEFGCHAFVVGGLCSAADAGWSVALADERVSALLMLDGLVYTGPWYHVARFAATLGRPPLELWTAFRRWLGRPRDPSPRVDVAAYRNWPARAEAQRQFESLVSRNVRSLWIYTGGYTDCFLHPRQFGWSFGKVASDPRVTVRYWPDCRHTFYARAHRDRLLATVQAWLIEAFQPIGARS